MKYIGQFCVIMLVTFLGELLNALIPLPIPAGIYGMALMFVGLWLKVIPLKAVDETGIFLVAIMPVMFIPAGVGLMNSWSALRQMLVPAVVAVTVVTVVVMAVAGRSAQRIIVSGNRRKRV